MAGKIARFYSNPSILSTASAVGKLEALGPLKQFFDVSSEDSMFEMDTWEKAEAEMVRQSTEIAIKKANLRYEDIDLSFSGDLTNQCASSSFGLKEKRIPHIGLYGACSTFALALGLSAMAIEANHAEMVLAEASSHFCSAERQYRFPLEYGCQRPPSAQTTVTASGCAILSKNQGEISVKEFLPGIIRDLGVTDANQMGAAMAPSCADTVLRYFDQSSESVDSFDLILTGDLGFEGHEIFLSLCKDEGLDLSQNSNDCGKMIYKNDDQKVNCCGGSGCGCSASVFCGYMINQMKKKKLRRLLLIGTGALLNATTVLQKETIPGVSHLVRIETEESWNI